MQQAGKEEGKEMEVDQKLLLGLLDKVRAPYTSKISQERAVKKLKRYLDRGRMPGNPTPDEEKLLKDLGLSSKEDSKKESKPKKSPREKKTKIYWMEAATKSILESDSLKEAAEKTKKMFKEMNNKPKLKCDIRGTLYVSYASKVLQMVGRIKTDGDKITHITQQ